MGRQKVLAKNDQIVFKDQSGTPMVQFLIGYFDVFFVIGLPGRHKP